MSSLRPTVSVIILNYNGAQHLPTCIESLQAQTLADQLEIIILRQHVMALYQVVRGKPYLAPY